MLRNEIFVTVLVVHMLRNVQMFCLMKEQPCFFKAFINALTKHVIIEVLCHCGCRRGEERRWEAMRWDDWALRWSAPITDDWGMLCHRLKSPLKNCASFHFQPRAQQRRKWSESLKPTTHPHSTSFLPTAGTFFTLFSLFCRFLFSCSSFFRSFPHSFSVFADWIIS